MNKKELGLLILLLAFSFFFRVVGLDLAPPSINFDEASLGYNAYSILKTGKDEYGVTMPLSLRSFNDYKPALYAYLSIPFVWMMGLNETSTRMASAVMGTVSLLFLYLILRKYVKKSFLILGMFLVSLQPWRLHYSRIAFESNVSMAFFTMGVWGWMNFKKSLAYKIVAALGFILSIYSYHGARMAVPLFLALSILDPTKIVREKKIDLTYIKAVFSKSWEKIVVAILIGVTYIPIFIESAKVLTRFNQTSVFTERFPYMSVEMVEKYGVFKGVAMLYHLLGIMSGHLLSVLSPRNLGTAIYDWIEKSPMVISGMGMMGFVEAILVLFGLTVLMSRIASKKYREIGYWIVAATAPVALTLNWYHPLRSLNAFGAIDMLMLIGFYFVYKRSVSIIKNKALKVAFALSLVAMFSFNSIYVINNEFVYGPWATHGQFQPGGFKEGMARLKELEPKYEKIYIDTPHAQSYVFFWFYQSMDPVLVQSFANSRPAPGERGKFGETNLIFDFGKYEYKKYEWLEDRKKGNFVYWVSGDVKKNEITGEVGSTYQAFPNVLFDDTAVIITKE